jgi:hypothetical protein
MIEQPANPDPREQPDVINQPPTEEKPLPRHPDVPGPPQPGPSPEPPPTIPNPIVRQGGSWQAAAGSRPETSGTGRSNPGSGLRTTS